MALRDTIEQLNNLDLADLDFNNIGMWPAAAKAIVLVLLFAAAAAAGYFLYLTPKLEERDRLVATEQQLRSEYTDKAMQSANLEELRQQRAEMEESFGALLRQLPSDTEVPGLLEDITLTGLDNGLKFSAIDLQPERTAEFYVELPIAITVEGGYHNMGAFVSGVANLSRIVTLHDFSLSPLGGEAAGQALNMQIQARTYRYLDTEGP
ncbi:MAG: type 4a pilus biogenesis protein PilO [Pseudomonadales bacterium]|jgi:type IV pilus assembly protein PilO|nr:type 4a pilus biogenesis protein PilO [Pseudomonadales bacterium]